MQVDYDDLQIYLDWTKTKSELKFNPQPKSFPILYNCVYWAFMGCNVGSEEGKHRPVLITKMCEKPTPLGVGWIAQIMCM